MQRTPTPGDGEVKGGDGRSDLSRCNNQERQWFGAIKAKIQVLAMQAQGLGMNEAVNLEQIRELERSIETARDTMSTEWVTVSEAMRSAGRTDAVTQATGRWTSLMRMLAGAAEIVAKEEGRLTGTRQKRNSQEQRVAGNTATPTATTTPTSTPAVTPTVEEMMRQMMAKLNTMEEKFKTRQERLQLRYEQRLEEEQRRRAEDERERAVRYNDELKKLAQDMKKKEQEEHRRGEAFKEEIKKLQQAIQGTGTGEGATSDDYWWDEAPLPRAETARERLHREPSPVKGNRRLGTLASLIPKENNQGESNGRQNGGTQTRRESAQSGRQQVQEKSMASGVLSRFGAYAGQIDMPATDPFRTTMEDEGEEYSRTNFPPPFNEPPPRDATRVTEFRKLEGLVPKFSGDEQDFHGWMALFIPTVHRVRCPVAWKAAVLNKGMDTSNTTLKNIVASSGATKEDYAGTIHKLVRAFAHPQGIVAAKLRDLDSVVAVREGDCDNIEAWLIKLEAYLTAARARGMSADIFSVQLYEDNLLKMDDSLAQTYLTWASLKDLPNNAVTICAWLEEKVGHAKQLRRRRGAVEKRAAMADRSRPRSSPPGKRSPRGAPQRHRNASVEAPRRRITRECPLDGEKHSLEFCPAFKAMKPTERRKTLRELKRCYACFGSNHNIGECTKGIRCANCPHYHHTLLHGSGSARRGVRRATDSRTMLTMAGEEERESEDDSDAWSVSSEPAETSQEAFKASGKGNARIVLQTVPIEVYNGTKKIKLNCLIDQGATGAFMSRKAAEELQITGYSARTKVTGFDGMVSEGNVMISNVQISALNHKKKYWVQVQVTKDPAGSYTPFDWTKNQRDYPQIKSLPLLPPIPGRDVDIMLGLDTPHLIKSLVPDVGGHEQQPVARFTRLGWVVGGPVAGARDEECRANFAFKAATWKEDEQQKGWSTYAFKTGPPDAREPRFSGKSKDEDLQQLVTRMWEIEAATGKSITTIQDEKIFKYLRKELKQTKDKKYLLPTLWKPGHPNIMNNYRYAEARLKSILDSKQLRDPKIREEYDHQIRDWLQQRYTQEVNTDDPAGDKAYYLPHFPVIRWDKATSKVRIVMDAAAKPSKGGSQLCLNDCLQKGPKLVNELPVVLLRYRAKPVAVAADIKKMYFQIKLRLADRDMHRFLWKEGDKIKVFRWAVHPFGSAASPCVAIFALKDHARRWRKQYPLAAETVIKSTLVDDNLDSCADVEEAVELGRQLVGLYKEAGMELSKVVSNAKPVREAFPHHMRAESLDIASFCTKDLDNPVVKTLGMVYLSQEDAFSYETNVPKDTRWTKRTILQHKAKLFDPHGLIAPHTVVAGLIIQKLWRQGKGWDDAAEKEELKEWTEWLTASGELPTLRIPRCIGRRPGPQDELHFFCDASADAYAAVAYYINEGESRLLVSKAKVAPLKATSIPRLELLAAELTLDLIKLARMVCNIPTKNNWYWSDSTNVLAWLRTESRSLHDFVGNRVAKILEETDVSHWRWVPTEENPADIPSRGANATKLRGSELWWQGPKFITRPKSEWPKHPQELQMPEEASREVKKGMAFTSRQEAGLTDRYEKEKDNWQYLSINRWSRTVRAVARCRRLLHRLSQIPPITGEEISQAESKLVRSMQTSALAASRAAVVQQTLLPGASPLRKLDPMIDQDGILRVGGRMAQVKFLPFEERHQVIIPKDHPWTEAIIRQEHRNLLHQGAAHVTTSLRRKWWIVRATQKVRAVITACVWCKRQRARLCPQKMAPIIPDRFPETRCRPFTYAAVDAAGPYYIIEQGKNPRSKAYLLLFTCCTVRAVHLEAVFDLGVNTFLMALDRFTARRGVPEQMRSDNGSNFTAAYSEMKRIWSREAVQEYQQNRPQIKWIFNPPRAPFTGGMFERLVGAAKRALYHVAKGNSAPTKEAFTTMVTVVESILNSRPLTCVSPDADAPEALTPGHFLGTEPYRMVAEIPGQPWDKRTLWRASQHRLDRLWARFCTEVRSSLQETQKWRQERSALQPGDVVVALENKQRGKWPLGRIIRVEESRDKLIRKVHVLINGHTVRRAVNTLVLLVPGSEPTKTGEVVKGQQELDEPEGGHQGEVRNDVEV